jgi:hypothetical protein
LDDAHVAFPIVRDAFTIEIDSEKSLEVYHSVSGLFREAFKEIDKLGTFDDVVSGKDFGVLEVPYWHWIDKIDAIREILKTNHKKFDLPWLLSRDSLEYCQTLLSKDSITITPILPLIRKFPSFVDCPKRIYMSATIADDSELIRTFDASPDAINAPLTSKSLAGISERMILIPRVMNFTLSESEDVKRIIQSSTQRGFGAIILTPSEKAAEKWVFAAKYANGSAEAESEICALQAGESVGPIVFANRYDGIDLPGNSCRLLIISGLPTGTSNYELYKSSVLYGGRSITRVIAQRIEQGIGRGARGAGDHCVILLMGDSLSSWISQNANYKFLTSATRTQIEMGVEISKEISSLGELISTIERSYFRETDWVRYHAETLAVQVENSIDQNLELLNSAQERTAMNLWLDGYHDKAIAKIEGLLEQSKDMDTQQRGWLLQFAARISYQWGNKSKADDLQKQAFASNKSLLRTKTLPPYIPLPVIEDQANAIAKQFSEYRLRRGVIAKFETVISNLTREASANQFEESLKQFAFMIGFSAERKDENGEGPDVLWLLPNNQGFIIEAKSRRLDKQYFGKEAHGQLLVASQWFTRNYEGYDPIRVSVHPKNLATKASEGWASHALTYEKIGEMISDARSLLSQLCESNLDNAQIKHLCSQLLVKSNIRAEHFSEAYLSRFEV